MTTEAKTKRVNLKMTPEEVLALRQIALDSGVSLQRLCADALRGVLRVAHKEVKDG